MKKRLVMIFAGVMASAVILSGCEASKGLETDDIKITQYKEVEVDQVEKPVEVTDEDVENQIQAVLESKAETKEILDRAVEEGDVVDIDFVGKIDGVEFEGGAAQGQSLEIGSGDFIEGFEDSIIGHTPGETFDWNGAFPEDYRNTDYAGKDVVFTITVNSITQEEIPELTDDFVKSVSDKSKSVKEYKEELKDQLSRDAQRSYQSQLNSEVIQKVLDNSEVLKYPEDKVKSMCDETIEQCKSIAKSQSMEYEDYLTQSGMSVEDFEKQVEDAVKADLKQRMVVEAIADKEKIKMTDEMYEEQLKEMAESYQFEDVDALKEAADEEDLKDIALYNVVAEWLAEHCIQKAS